MATAKKTQIVITANAAVAKKVMEELQRRVDAIKQKMAALDVTTKEGQREFKKLEKELVSYNSAATQNIKNYNRMQHAIKNLSTTSLKDLKRALSAAKSEMNKMTADDKRLPLIRKRVETLQTQIDKMTGAAKKQGGAWQTAMKNLTAYVGLFGAFNMIKSKLTDVLKLNFQYSDSLANVRKVSNLSMDSVNDLSRMLAKVDSRTSLEGLTQLAYVGSRMGMGKYGAEGLAEFAKASDRVNVALKEDLGDDAMLTLSKFVETMGEVEKHGGNISSAFDAVSSSIFKLASTSTANGKNILEFAKRLTGLSKVTHITSDQLLGLASASDSLMLMPEVASTAFGKLISSLWTNYHEIEKMLGLQEDSLKGMMEKGQTMQALVTVLENVSDKNLNSMDAYFKEFGSDGQRLKQTVVTMAQNVDVLKAHLQESSDAYESATAVQKEYAIQQETAQALMERANNMWEKAFVNPEGIDVMKDMAKSWYDFSKMLTQSQPFLASVKVLMWELKMAVTVLLTVLPGLVAYLGTRGLVWAFSKLIPLMAGISVTGIVRFFSLLTGAAMGSRMAVGRLIVSWRQMNLAMKTNVIGLAISLVAELGMWIYSLVKKTDDATKSVDKFSSSLDGVQSKANQAQGELDAYYNAILKAKKGSNEYKAAMKVYNEKFGQYFKNLKKENGIVLDLAESYRLAAKAIRAKIYAQSMQEDRDKYLKPRLGWGLDRLAEYGKVAPSGFGADVLRGFEEDYRNKSVDEIKKVLAKKFGVKDPSFVWNLINSGVAKFPKRYYKEEKRSFLGLSIGGGKGVKTTLADERYFRAMRYVLQARSARKTDRNLDRKYDPVRNEIIDYEKSLLGDGDENLGGGSTTHKTTGKNDKPRKEEQQAKARANALIANIKAFYEEQKRKYLEWVTTMNADGEKVSEGQQQQMLDYIDSRENLALGKAKHSIATLSKEWEDFLKDMPVKDMMVQNDETSKDLIEAMKGADIKELHDLFEKLSKELSKENHQTIAENVGALLNQIFANGSKNLREAAEKLLAQQREIQKILNENDYTGAVNRDTRSNFDKLGFLKPAKGLRAASSSGLQQMNESFDALTTKARTSVAELYKLDPASKSFKSDFLEYISVANEGFDFSALGLQKLKALYYELIKYTEEYTEAEKRQYDKAKKIIDFEWSKKARNKEIQDRIKSIELQQKMYGAQSTFGSNLGLTDIKNDPEIALMKARMQAAEDYYAYVKASNKNQQLVNEAERARQEAELAYVNQVAASMKTRLSQMRSFVQPIEDFGSAVGQALATMKNDADSANKAIRNALKSMLEAWGKMALDDVNKQMWQAINNAGVNRAKKKAQPDIEAARQSAKSADLSTIGMDTTIGTKSNPAHVFIAGGVGLESLGANKPDDTTEAFDPYTHDYSKPTPENLKSPDAQYGKGASTPNHTGAAAGSHVDTATASQAGTAVADAVTGKSSLSETAAGIGGSLLGDVMNMKFKTGGKKKSKEDKERAKQLKKEKKHQKELSKEAKKGTKEREEVTESGAKNMAAATEQGNKEQTKGTEAAQRTMVDATDAALNTTLTAKQANNDATLQSDAQRTRGEVTFSIAGAMAKCFEFLGPIAGPIAAAVVMSTLMGLLQWALGAAFGEKKNNNSPKEGANTKIVSGMLTYDNGNVQDLKPFVGDNGEVYWAKEQDKPQSGVSLLTQPTATTINGQRSLVAENGPELVVGRETTKAMMMNNPSLLKALVNYDANYSGRNAARRAFDEGNLAEVSGNLSSGASATDGLIADSQATNIALMAAIDALMQRLDQPINAKIDMYGRGNLYDSMTKANQFMKGKS